MNRVRGMCSVQANSLMRLCADVFPDIVCRVEFDVRIHDALIRK